MAASAASMSESEWRQKWYHQLLRDISCYQRALYQGQHLSIRMSGLLGRMKMATRRNDSRSKYVLRLQISVTLGVLDAYRRYVKETATSIVRRLEYELLIVRRNLDRGDTSYFSDENLVYHGFHQAQDAIDFVLDVRGMMDSYSDIYSDEEFDEIEAGGFDYVTSSGDEADVTILDDGVVEDDHAVDCDCDISGMLGDVDVSCVVDSDSDDAMFTE